MKEALKTLNSGISDLHTNKKELYIMGDLNIDYSNSASLAYKQLILFQKTNNLEQYIKTTTRNTSKSKTLLDLVLSDAKYIKEAGTLDSFISDHQPIYIIKKKLRNTWAKNEFTGRTYKNYDQPKMKENLLQINWAEYYTNKNVDEKWHFLINAIEQEVDRSCPIMKHKIKKVRPQYLTQNIENQMKDRDYFYKKAKQTGDEDDWNIAKHLRNRVKINLRTAKAEYIKTQLNVNQDNAAKFWRVIKEVFPTTQKNPKIQTKLQGPQGEISPNDIPDYVNDFFINVGTNLVSDNKVKRTKKENPREISAGSQLVLEGVTHERILTLLKQINTNKSSGVQDLRASVLRDALQILSSQVCSLVNDSIQTKVFPQKLKEATVVPIPKTGNPKQVNNYRPISLLPMPSKLIEKVVHEQIEDFMEEEGQLSDFQHGFRKMHSTTHAITDLLTNTHKSLDNQEKTVALFIDFKKAFDCVQFPILLEKLTQAGISTDSLQWIKSYLRNRKQRTRINGQLSTLKTVKQGVPQGSILGPLFYILYANDIEKSIFKSRVVFYADDTVIYASAKNVTKAIARVQKDLNNLLKWCIKNGLHINPQKTKYMIFSNQKVETEQIKKPLRVRGEPIERVTTYCYLGVHLDEHLTYETHTRRTINKVTAKNHPTKKNKNLHN